MSNHHAVHSNSVPEPGSTITGYMPNANPGDEITIIAIRIPGVRSATGLWSRKTCLDMLPLCVGVMSVIWGRVMLEYKSINEQD